MSLSATAHTSPPGIFPLRPTSLLRARARVVEPAAAAQAPPITPGRGYFQSLSSRKTYSIDELLSLRMKFALCPKDLPDLACVESGGDDTLTWGLRSYSTSSSLIPQSDVKRTKLKVKVTKSMDGPLAPESDADPSVVPLAVSQNRWRPQASSGFSSTLKKLKGILNKLTVDKFEQLSQQFVTLLLSNCPTIIELREAVQLVFDKALDEMSFGDMYTNLVVLLSEKIPAIPSDQDSNQTKKSSFKSVMLSMCQTEFEKAYMAVLPGTGPPSAGPQNVAQDEVLRLKQRQRLLGNMKFIGELFNKNMLNVGAIFYCARQLSAGLRPDHLEAVCTLLEVTGPTLDSAAMKGSQNQVREIFQRIAAIANMSPSSSEIDSRTRFLVREILELRSGGWVPRRKKQEAMKIDEFRAKEEPFRQQFRTTLLPDEAPIEPTRPTMPSSMRPLGAVRTPRYTDRYSRAQSVHTLSPMVSDSDLAKKYQGVKKDEVPSLTATTAVSSTPSAQVVPALSEEKILKSVGSMIREFVSINDMKEALLCVDELTQPDNTFRNIAVVSSCINQALEMSEAQDRATAASLICQLRGASRITISDIEDGIKEVLSCLSDIEVDLPIAPKRLGEFLAILIKDGSLSPAFVGAVSSEPSVEAAFLVARS